MRIKVNKLQIPTIIGTNAHERQERQNIIVNIEFEYDGSLASRTDDLRDALNYKELADEIIKKVENSSFFLLEKLAFFIMEIIQSKELVSYTEIEVLKPNALYFAESISVKIDSNSYAYSPLSE